MITEAIYSLLKNDKRLKETTITQYATTQINNSIVFTVIPQSSDKIKESYRVEVTCIDTDYGHAMELLETVKDILLTFGDDQLTDKILSVVQNGGSSLKNESTKTYHLAAYFDIKKLV